MRIGIIREGKTPPDRRVALVPEQCARLREERQLNIVVQPSPIRTFTDEEYQHWQVPLVTDVSDCDLLLGIKEVPLEQLIPNKTYCFFAHVIKKQPYNRKLLRTILDRRITLIDYEVITNERGKRLIAFGVFAGMVGAHNALWAYAQRTGTFALPRMNDLHDYAAAQQIYHQLTLPPVRIVLTGMGRVGQGAVRVLEDMGVARVGPEKFLHQQFDHAVYTQIEGRHYAHHRDGRPFEKRHFYRHPQEYQSSFAEYARIADIMINGIYWDNHAPAFFSREDMQQPDFRIQTIADVTCDIAPVASIPATLKASTIADPVFGYDPVTNREVAAFTPGAVDVMSIDNLPSEMPRDASRAFGEMFIEYVLPELLRPNSPVIERATVAHDGQLGKHFQYLEDYVSTAYPNQ